MTVYILLFLSFVILAYKCQNNNRLGSVMLLVLFVFSAFRGTNVGTDTKFYLDIANNISFSEALLEYSISSINRDSELLRFLINETIVNNGLSNQYIIVIYSLITFICLYFAGRRLSLSLPMLSLLFLLTYYLISFNICRQIAASTIVLLAYSYIVDEPKKKDYLNFIGLIIMASLIHTTSLIALLLLPLRYISFDKKKLLWISSALFAINIIYPLPFSEILYRYLDDGSYGSVYRYLAVTSGRSIVGAIVSLIEYLLFSSIFYYGCNDDKTHFADNIMYWGIFASILFGNSDSVIGRAIIPVVIYQIVYICRLFQNDRQINRNVQILFIAFVCYNTFFKLYFASQGQGEIVPYYMEFNLF